MLCLAQSEILVKLSGTSLFSPRETSMGDKEDDPREPLFYGKLYTGQRVSAPPKIISGAEELIKSRWTLKAAWEKSFQAQGSRNGSGHSKPVQQMFGVWFHSFDIKGSFIPDFCCIWGQNPGNCKHLLYTTFSLPLPAESISAALHLKKRIAHCM